MALDHVLLGQFVLYFLAFLFGFIASSCRFVTFVGIASLIVSAVQAWRTFYYLCKGHDDSRVRVFVSLSLSSALLGLLFVAGMFAIAQ
ncbi:hypothetical protein NHX12_026073, partial [Muraenolepis orangiensis]